MATEWFCKVGAVEQGPLSVNELKALADRGSIGPDDFVRKGREGAWTRAAKVQGLFMAAALPVPATVEPSRPAAAAPALPPSPTRIEIKAVYTQPAAVAPPAMAASQPAPPFAGYSNQAAPAWPQPAPSQAAQPSFAQPPAHYPLPPPQPYQQQPYQQQPYQQPAPWAYPSQPQPQQVVIQNTIVNQQVAYVATRGKSVLLAVVLAALLGPLGMLYSTVTGAVVIFLVNVVFVVPTVGGILLITWPLGIIWAAVAASK
ncbi:MAG TPA: DUF4339 domain-containing protein [Pirellulales bacterium]